MHFLIIDEHPADRDKIIRLLKDTFQNAALTVVDSPETYRQVLTTGPFDCVLTEHTLDWTDGLIVLHELKARWPDVPVIIVTGSGSEQTAVEGFRAGLQDYVRKDQIQTELIPAIRRAAKHKPMEQALRESEETARRQLAEIDSIYGSAPIGLAVLDSELRYVRINDRLAQMNGIPAAAHIGKTVRELLPDLADQAEAIYRDIVSTGEPLLDIEFSGTTPAEPDRARTWLANWLPLRDSGGQVIGMNVVTYEVTERKRPSRRCARAVSGWRGCWTRPASAYGSMSYPLGPSTGMNRPGNCSSLIPRRSPRSSYFGVAYILMTSSRRGWRSRRQSVTALSTLLITGL